MKHDATSLLFVGAAFSFLSSVAHAQQSVPPFAGSFIPQVVDGGAWATTIVLTNTGANPSELGLSFYQETGGGATQPWLLDFAEATSAQSRALSLPAGSTLFLHTLGAAAATTAGWGELSSPAGSSVAAYTTFTERIPGRPDEEGTAEPPPAPCRCLVPFDNTNGVVTGIAIANVSNDNISISVGIRTPVSTTQGAGITLPPLGHTSFVLPAQFPATAGQTGLAEFYGSSNGFSIIALRFSPGSFTAVPVYSPGGPPIIVSAH